MKQFEKLKEKKVLVVGLGRSGIVAANLLHKAGARVEVTDVRKKEDLNQELNRLNGNLTCHLGGHSEVDLFGIDFVIVSPGVPWNSPFLKTIRGKGIEIISELEFAAGFPDAPLIAVTGTNGKTTTVSLIGEILRKAGKRVFVGGNIGTPLSELVLSGETVDYVVCEVSTFQLEGIKKFRPYISAVLNVTPDHLDRHSGMSEYVGLKKRIYENQKKGDFLILNCDDPITASFKPNFELNTHHFSLRQIPEEGAFYRNGTLSIRRKGENFPLCCQKDLSLRGDHNMENVLAAAAVASICEIDPEIIKSAVVGFEGIKNRMEYVAEIDGITFINDSKGTNVGAAVRSIESVDAPVILIAGGKDKGGDYSPLKDALCKKVKYLILIGEASQKISSIVNGFPPKVRADSLTQAVEVAFERAKSGDLVLLSPACSSFDMFKNYEERGECFRKAVDGLRRLNVKELTVNGNSHAN